MRTLAVPVVVLIVAGCSPYYTQDPGPRTPPIVTGIEWSSDQNQYDSDCVLGLTVDGLTYVAGAGTYGLGSVAAEWLSFTITGSLTPIGAELPDCWNALTSNNNQFALLMHCSGEPTIKYWFDNMGDAERWAAIPFCQCNLTCQGMSSAATTATWYAADRRARFRAYCGSPQIDWMDTSCLAPSPNGWPLGRHGVSAVDTDPTDLLPDGSPLPPSWGVPWWDTTAPVPPHPVNCALPDCSDQLN